MSRSVEPPYQHQGPDPGRKSPHLPMRPELTKDEIRVLKECSTESFWYRCFPLAIVMISASQFAVNRGYLTRHPKYGGLLKNLGAGVLAYILGKFSYQGECRRKILELPDSRLGDAIRKKKGLQISEEMSVPEFPTVERRASIEKPLKEVYSGMDFSSDKDATKTVQGLDDRQRPSLDNEVQFTPDKEEVSASEYVNYDDLREKNRQEYQLKGKGPPAATGVSPRDPFNARPWPVPSPRDRDQSGPASPHPPPSPQKSKPTSSNKYGDVWDE